ncbi:MAG TPA: hypothetical protein VF572_03750 [Candidatus Saccharimonadales bacterium]|jgi:hypothetical protein
MKLHRRLLVSATLALALTAGAVLAAPAEVHAEGLQIRPLMYREALEQGKSKQGFVDVSNPSSVAVTVTMDVRGFRQADGQGNLRFFTSQVISSGITLDLKEVELGPREAARVYFAIDSNKLPKGDIFAAIFAATKSPAGAGIVPSAQVGTLLLIQNGQPGPRRISIQSLDVSPIQIGEAVRGAATLKNPAPVEPSSGFFPKVTVSLRPIGELKQQIDAPLVMSGVSREIPFKLAASRIGLYKLTVASGGSSVDKWAVVVTGFWRWVLLGLAGLMVFTVLLVRRSRRRRKTPQPTELEQGTADAAPGPVPDEPPAEPTAQATEPEVSHADTPDNLAADATGSTKASGTEDPVVMTEDEAALGKPAGSKTPATAPELAVEPDEVAPTPQPAAKSPTTKQLSTKPVNARKKSHKKLKTGQ